MFVSESLHIATHLTIYMIPYWIITCVIISILLTNLVIYNAHVDSFHGIELSEMNT